MKETMLDNSKYFIIIIIYKKVVKDMVYKHIVMEIYTKDNGIKMRNI